MKTFFFFLAAAGLVYGFIRYVPAESRQRTLEKFGLARLFGETIPGYLRQKLSIPENPAAKRKKLIGELASSIAAVERELETVAGEGAVKKTAGADTVEELKEKVERAQEILNKSEAGLAELEKTNSGDSIFRKAAERVLDKILPAPSPRSAPLCESGSG